MSSLYRINGTSGATCILIRTDALLSIKYFDIYNQHTEADVFLPDDPVLSGECYDDESSITMVFSDFTLSMYFRKVTKI